MLRVTAVVGIVALGTLATVPQAKGQQPGKVWRIGVLSTAPPEQISHLRKALEEGLGDLGYAEGRNMVLEYRSAEGRVERLPGLAAELVRLKVDVIIPTSTPAALAARQATTTIPIAMVSPADPVSAGLIASLARPGGNLTGLTLEVTLDTWGRYLQLLQEAVPAIRRVAALANPAYPPNAPRRQAMEEPARRLGVALLPAEARGPNEIEHAFGMMIRKRADGVCILGDPVLFSLRGQIADLATKNRLPTVFPYGEGADAGGLLSYGPHYPDTYRRLATYVDKILKGVKPADLPVEQPTRFELVINLRTATALGLTMPRSLLSVADEVIQ